MSAPGEELRPIATHFELLGYEVEIDADGDLTARHPTDVDFVVRPMHAGVLLMALFRLNEAAQGDKQGVRRLVRKMNEQAIAMRIVVPPGHADLLQVEAWLPLPYERVAFGRFLALCQHEARLHPLADEATLKAYLT